MKKPLITYAAGAAAVSVLGVHGLSAHNEQAAQDCAFLPAGVPKVSIVLGTPECDEPEKHPRRPPAEHLHLHLTLGTSTMSASLHTFG
jgi:hypothetical protein